MPIKAAARCIRHSSQRDLIDRLLLITFPVLLGHGKSIFDRTQGSAAIKLTDHFVSRTGVSFAAYEPAGEVPTGSFATKEPSAEERERQAKIAEGTW